MRVCVGVVVFSVHYLCEPSRVRILERRLFSPPLFTTDACRYTCNPSQEEKENRKIEQTHNSDTRGASMLIASRGSFFKKKF